MIRACGSRPAIALASESGVIGSSVEVRMSVGTVGASAGGAKAGGCAGQKTHGTIALATSTELRVVTRSRRTASR